MLPRRYFQVYPARPYIPIHNEVLHDTEGVEERWSIG